MKVTDYIANFLSDNNIKYVFGVTGGYIVHLFDSIAKRDGIDYICTNHEQAAAIAADSYTRLTNSIGVAISTSGPGAANLINGVMCSYYDSIPTLIITGQSPLSSLDKNKDTIQCGFQEIKVSEIYKSFTKYSTQIKNPNDVPYELEKALHIAKSGRRGPVVLDIPDDIQRDEINILNIKHYVPMIKSKLTIDDVNKSKIISLLSSANKPIIILGAGICNSNIWNRNRIRKLINNLNMPIVVTWGAVDAIDHNSDLFAGTFGTIGTIYGNDAIQNADIILAVGTRLDDHSTTTKVESFGKNAKRIIVVDIDDRELQRLNRVGMSKGLFINAHSDSLFDILDDSNIKSNCDNWINEIKDLKKKYPICKKDYYEQDVYVNPYVFLEKLSNETNDDDIIFTDAGANLSYTMQGYKVKGNQRLISDVNHSTMGYSLPASIGASIARNGKKIICIIGDGAIQMNIQELDTIHKYHLPIKIFVFNDCGYGMIRQTQDDWLNSRYEASDSQLGVSCPRFENIAEAYGIKTETINNHKDLYKISNVLKSNDAILCNVRISPSQKIHPKLLVGKSLEEI